MASNRRISPESEQLELLDFTRDQDGHEILKSPVLERVERIELNDVQAAQRTAALSNPETIELNEVKPLNDSQSAATLNSIETLSSIELNDVNELKDSQIEAMERKWRRPLNGRESLFGRVIEAIRDGLPNAELLSDRHSQTRYYIVKLNGKTIGYVSGQDRVRVQAREIERSVLVSNPVQIQFAVEFLQQEAATCQTK